MIYTFLNPKGGVGWTHGSRFAAMVRTAFALLVVFLCVLSGALAAVNDEPQFIFNTFSFLVWGGLVMWMAAGFTMLESDRYVSGEKRAGHRAVRSPAGAPVGIPQVFS